LVITDLLSIVFVPNGLYVSELYTDNWILGYKSSRVYIAVMPLLLFAALNDYIENGKLTFVFHLLSLLGIADVFLSKGTGGTAATALLYGLIVIYDLFRKYRLMGLVNRVLKPKVMLPIIAILVLMFAIFQKFDILEFIIVGILHKNMTLTNRTKIWTACLELFKTSPIIGKGYIISDQFIELTGVRGGTQPHNQVLSLLVYSGIVGLAIYLCLLYCVSKKTDQDWSSLSKITFLYIIANLILGIVSMNIFGEWHYAVYIVLYYLNSLDRQKYDELI
jgi:O-antigen ligase